MLYVCVPAGSLTGIVEVVDVERSNLLYRYVR